MIRSGLGVDAHAFDPSRPLVLAGVTIAEGPGLAGHSDADVVSHAIGDALLGAVAAGDLGEMFPSDERWKDASSLAILRNVSDALNGAGWQVVNVDATVIAQTPRLEAYRSDMIANLAETLGLARGCVSVKATTTDGMGFTGGNEGIAALAIATVARAGED